MRYVTYLNEREIDESVRESEADEEDVPDYS